MFKKRNDYTRQKSTKAITKFQTIYSILVEVFRIILGIVFVFSGFVKAIDPSGNAYKIQDYLTAFGGNFANLSSLAYIAAIALSTLELLIGLCFLFKVKLKTTSIIALLFMLVMLPLTLYIAIKNPVTDCGCFGDALKISNWETFFKNVVLIILVVFLLANLKKLHNLFLPKMEWFLILFFASVGVGISMYSNLHLPMIDFLPYKVGINIPEAMKVPDGKPTDKFDTKLIYEKNGVQQEFTVQNYPKNDSTWKFVDQKTVLISKGFEPPIHNFIIEDAQANDVTYDVISFEGITNLVVMYDLGKVSDSGVDKAQALYDKTKSNGERFYALTGASDEEIMKFTQQTKVTFPLYKVDGTTLKTIIRANPGFVKIKNGTITGKWNWRDF